MVCVTLHGVYSGLKLQQSQQHPAPCMTSTLKDDRSKYVAPYPPEMILSSMMMMANGTPASKVTENIVAALTMTKKLGKGIDEEKYNWPDETTLGRWRYGMAYVCQVHIGMELTKAANNKRQVFVYACMSFMCVGMHSACVVYACVFVIRACMHAGVNRRWDTSEP